MKKELILRKYDYIMPASSFTFASLDLRPDKTFTDHPVKLEIDFEKGYVNLQGNLRFMIAVNDHNEVVYTADNRERVKIETTIFQSQPVDLNDYRNDGLVLLLISNKENFSDQYSGLLVFDNIRGANGLISNQWTVSIYLYSESDAYEIKFKLPLFTSVFSNCNNYETISYKN
jgi:hypothetical protein